MSTDQPTHSPLCSRDLPAQFAHLTTAPACLNGLSGAISTRQFLAHVQALAIQLPDKAYAINLCENRYLFTVAFCAVLARGQTNLLPPNKAEQTLLATHSEDSYCLHDDSIAADLPGLDLRATTLLGEADDTPVPKVSNQHIAAICFTSGSTGQSQPIIKTWGTLHAANHHNARFMLAGLEHTAHQIATVPGQHMWGLETTVLMPLVANLILSDAKPFYPADIAKLAAELPGPRVMVSTPIHLRALVNAGIELPSIDLVMSATAPLSTVLAQQVTQAMDARIAEVYGCSEFGSMAVRDTAKTETWTLFDAFQFEPQEDGSCRAYASHIKEEIILGDLVELIGDNQFKLGGRTDDTINIAGKRGSLAELNRVLLQCQGVLDGVVFLPPEKQRLAALVILQPDFSKEQLAQYFRQHIDAAFVPRPMLAVAALPRSDNSKLSKKAVLELYQRTVKPKP